MIASETDVVVIGGGPAGTTAATLIAQKGHRVILCERDRFPRFHIGESLIPETYWVLERLNLLGKLKGSRFVKKYGVQFVTETGKLSAPFYFWDHKPQESSQTWQVERAEFDQLLLNNAREHGVQAHEGTRVLEVLFDGDRATGVRVRTENGQEQVIQSKVVVDASGMSSLILDRLGLRQWDNDLKKAAVWTYWEGAWRGEGKDEGATLVMQTEGKRGWFWYIPLHNNRVSVGVVSDHDTLLKSGTKDLETIFFREVDRCPGVKERIASGKRCADFFAAKEYSYYAREATGNGWVLVGDALGFLDPLYSSGVLLALKSGQLAADAISEGLDRDDLSASQLGYWVPDYKRGMERMRRLVVEFYNGFNFGAFIKRHPHLRGYITDLLIGDLFDAKVDVLWPLIDEMRAETAA